MDFLFEGYDLTLAVVARRTLLFEPNNGQIRAEKFREPTKEFLKGLALPEPPKQMICFTGKPFHFPEAQLCQCTNAFAVSPYHMVAYLGTIFNKPAFAEYCKRKGTKQWQEFAQRPKIVFDRYYCFVPIPEEEISEVTIIKALKGYLANRSPKLAKATICLLSQEKGYQLNRQIWLEAERTATPASKPEFLKGLEDDEV